MEGLRYVPDQDLLDTGLHDRGVIDNRAKHAGTYTALIAYGTPGNAQRRVWPDSKVTSDLPPDHMAGIAAAIVCYFLYLTKKT